MPLTASLYNLRLRPSYSYQYRAGGSSCVRPSYLRPQAEANEPFFHARTSIYLGPQQTVKIYPLHLCLFHIQYYRSPDQFLLRSDSNVHPPERLRTTTSSSAHTSWPYAHLPHLYLSPSTAIAFHIALYPIPSITLCWSSHATYIIFTAHLDSPSSTRQAPTTFRSNQAEFTSL